MSSGVKMKFEKIAFDLGEIIENSIQSLVNTEKGRKTVKTGADGTPTKYIDYIAEKCIIDYMEDNDLPCELISEEIGRYKRGEEFTIIADPIDGTTNACYGIPFFSVSLAFYKEKAEFAFVKNLANGNVFTADDHAYLNNKRIKTCNSKIISLYTFSEVTSFLEISKKIRNFGSQALELCFVACGKSKAFIDVRNRGRFFDVAAAKHIIEKSGGVFTYLGGNEISMSAKNFSFVASCSDEVQTKIINIIKTRYTDENRNSLKG